MLIELDKSIIEFIENNKNVIDITTPEIIAINSIAKSYFMGKHLLIAELEVLEFLLDCTVIDELSKRVFNDLLNKRYYFDVFRERVDYYIVVKKNINKVTRNKNIFYIPLENLCDIRECMLISENRSDSKFYKSLCNKMICEIPKYNDYEFYLEEDDFGGSQVAVVVDNEIKKGRFCLYIVDNDKDYLEHNGGTTLESAEDLYKREKNNYVMELYALKVREKENLISPFAYLLCTQVPELKLLNFLKKYPSVQKDEEFMKFLDLKDGIIIKKYNEKNVKWHGLYDGYLQEMEGEGLLQCKLSEICSKKESEFILKGVGAKLNERFTEEVLDGYLHTILKNKEQNPLVPPKTLDELRNKVALSNNVYHTLPEYLKNEWNNIFKILYSWGCCSLENSIGINS